jgi:hypothetical protein
MDVYIYMYMYISLSLYIYITKPVSLAILNSQGIYYYNYIGKNKTIIAPVDNSFRELITNVSGRSLSFKVFIYIHIYIYMYVCMYVYTHIYITRNICMNNYIHIHI